MTILSFFIIKKKDHPFFSKVYGDVVFESILKEYRNIIEIKKQDYKPVLSININGELYSYISIEVDNIYTCCVTNGNENVIMLIEYMYKFYNLILKHFKDINHDIFDDNYILIDGLLNETFDYGIPQTIENDIFKEYLKIQNDGDNNNSIIPNFITKNDKIEESKNFTKNITNHLNGRKDNIFYNNNMFYMKHVEYISGSIDNNNIKNLIINGEIAIKCEMTGKPKMKIVFEDEGLDDKNLKNIIFDKNVIRENNVLQIIPPDGIFSLIKYEYIKKDIKPIFYCIVIIKDNITSLELQINIKPTFKPNFKVTNIKFKIPVPNNIIDPDIKGFVYDRNNKKLILGFKEFRSDKLFEKKLELKYIKDTKYIKEIEPIICNFEVENALFSTLRVKSASMIKSYESYEYIQKIKIFIKSKDYIIKPIFI